MIHPAEGAPFAPPPRTNPKACVCRFVSMQSRIPPVSGNHLTAVKSRQAAGEFVGRVKQLAMPVGMAQGLGGKSALSQ
jgi:hypothetical protein